LVSLDAAGAVRPYLPTRYWLAWIDFFREPIVWRGIDRGLGIQAGDGGGVLGAGWGNFGTREIKGEPQAGAGGARAWPGGRGGGGGGGARGRGRGAAGRGRWPGPGRPTAPAG